IVSHEKNASRYAKLKDTMAAAKKRIPVWSLADLGLSADDVSSDFTEIGELFVPQTDSHCEFLQGDAEEQASLLVARLQERGAI
ncbi:electron transfer flavoprotein subunit beta/FixA family protein, partial [Patescibacteria group bacterium]|nr:electron transfer flavoprotein subunit beta/FixA family protein [Patescibacteria group bacterium]